jgi:flavin reductase (DIM6/NTAB) family NADH-FMN oxidoreductase RutF
MFRTINPKELTSNVFSLLQDQWTLISAGEAEHCNTMTASWGGLGVLFHKNVATIYVRPQRYTFEFLEQYPEFTLSFFEENHRNALKLMGSTSGRDTDKINESGLTLAMAGETAPYFEEASLVLVCRKLYYNDLDPQNFVDPSLAEFFEKHDYHRMYIGEITQALVK